MGHSVFHVLNAVDLTRLQIRYDWRQDHVLLHAFRGWDTGTDFSRYNHDFTITTLHPRQGLWLSHEATHRAFEDQGALIHLERILHLMRKGRHRLLDCYFHAPRGIRFVNHVHSDRHGLNNGRSSLMMGGIRRHEPGDEELDVFLDGMNLARGMTFKNAAAGVPMGGCKTTVQMPPIDLDDLEAVGFLAFATDSTRNTTGPDMGFPTELTRVVKEHFSIHFTGAPDGPVGPTGTPTAYGVFRALQEAARFVWGEPSLAGRSIAIQGLGAVGHHLGRFCLDGGARLIVCDRDAARVDAFASAFRGAPIEIVPADDFLRREADILSPCAGGGIFDAENIPSLRYRIILGGANNTLRAASQEEEIELARLLAARGILYQVDWWHNGGGVMTGYEEYVHQDDASFERLMDTVGSRCAERTRENLEGARNEGVTPTERAYRAVEKTIYGDDEAMGWRGGTAHR